VTRLVVCRHADPTGPEGALALSQVLLPLRLSVVYASPLTRARETAQVIAEPRGLTPILVGDLREIEVGEVDGLAFDDYPAELQDGLLRAPERVRFPGGESYADMRGRVTRAVRGIVARHPGATVGVVTHAGPLRALLGNWLEMRDEAVFRLDQGYGAINIVDWTDGVPFVRLVNGPWPLGYDLSGASAPPMTD
jgi:broad specificity phosphatase PhoE